MLSVDSQKSQDNLRQVIDTIPTLVWCTGPNGSTEFLNKRWHDYTGFTPEESRELSRSLLEPFLFHHVMRSWLFGILLSEAAEVTPDAELLAVAAILHDLGLTERYTAENRFEVDGANAAREYMKDRGISAQRTQVVWDAHCTPHDPNASSPQRA